MGITPVLADMGATLGTDAGSAAARILLAAALGSIIGWERERHGRAAGLRTHLLLCTGCALVMLVSLYLPTLFMGFGADTVLKVDPGRVAAHVLSGLGFLGAGAIIVLGRRIRGLTTAACVWVTAGVGLAVGCGYYFPAVLTVAVAVFALHVLGRWERYMPTKDRFIGLEVRFANMDLPAEAVANVLRAHDLEVLSHTTDWRPDRATHRMQLSYTRRVDFHQVATALVEEFGDAGLAMVRWT